MLCINDPSAPESLLTPPLSPPRLSPTDALRFSSPLPREISIFNPNFGGLRRSDTKFANLSKFDIVRAKCFETRVFHLFSIFPLFSLIFGFPSHPKKTYLPLPYLIVSIREGIDPFLIPETVSLGGRSLEACSRRPHPSERQPHLRQAAAPISGKRRRPRAP